MKMRTFYLNLLAQGQLSLGYPSAILVAVWLLTMLSLPLVQNGVSDAALKQGIVFGVFVQVAVVIAFLWRVWGWKHTFQLVVSVIGLAWLAEYIGSQSGFPFGHYQYTEILQPQLGHVPILIPLAWLMMLPPTWAVAEWIGRKYKRLASRPAFIILSALAFTAWDLFLDPQMVLWGFWRWDTPGIFFGIPLSNYFGWLLVSGLITAIVRPSKLPILPLLAIYILTWSLQTIGQNLFWGLPGPALFGFLGMGYFILLALLPPVPWLGV